MAESHDALQAQFVELTGADAATAHFYLESSGWKLDAATATFFDNAGGLSSPVAAPPAAKPAPPHSTPMPHAQPAHVGGGHQASAPGPMPSGKPAGAKRPPAARGGGGRVKTFGEIRSAESDEEEEEKEQSYYAGGAASGQVVKSGSRKPAADPADIVKNVFESAKSHGAEVVDPHEHGGKEEKAKPFEGAGFRLGTSVSPSVPDPATVKKPAAHAPPKDRLVVITFWRTGFSVDDGPLRKFDDPANKPFLDDVHSGHIPRELQALAQGAQLNVNLVDKSHEDYTPPKVVVKPFAGAGNKLGNTPAPAPAPAAASAASAASHAAPAAPAVDNSQPSTTLQIRLADGTRLVAKFNHTATVAQLRAFIDAARVGSKAYQLQTPMPVVILNDNSKTLKELGLLNATVIQKML